MKMKPKVSIDTISIDPSIHRRLCPSMVWGLSLHGHQFWDINLALSGLNIGWDLARAFIGVSHIDDF
jgi:hypothetical protein